MEELWRNRRPPVPLDLDALLVGAHVGDGHAGALASAQRAPTSATAGRTLGLSDPHTVWDVHQSAAVFLLAVQLFVEGRPDGLGAAQVARAAARCMWTTRSLLV